MVFFFLYGKDIEVVGCWESVEVFRLVFSFSIYLCRWCMVLFNFRF